MIQTIQRNTIVNEKVPTSVIFQDNNTNSRQYYVLMSFWFLIRSKLGVSVVPDFKTFQRGFMMIDGLSKIPIIPNIVENATLKQSF